jgi:hypothetical protein
MTPELHPSSPQSPLSARARFGGVFLCAVSLALLCGFAAVVGKVGSPPQPVDLTTDSVSSAPGRGQGALALVAVLAILAHRFPFIARCLNQGAGLVGTWFRPPRTVPRLAIVIALWPTVLVIACRLFDVPQWTIAACLVGLALSALHLLPVRRRLGRDA